MTPAEVLLLALWGIYLADGSRWSRDDVLAASGLPGLGTFLAHTRVHLAAPWPWFWRVLVEEPERRAAKQKPLPETAVATEVRRTLSPASWNRRLRVCLRATRGVAAWNAATLVLSILCTLVLLTPHFGLTEEQDHRLGPWVLPLFQLTALVYLAGIAAGGLAAWQLRRWLARGSFVQLAVSALYPPQGLRWRLKLTERAMPPTHPVTVALARLPVPQATDLLRRARVRWAEQCQTADLTPMERLWATALSLRLETLLAQRAIPLAELEAPPVRDSQSSRSYCPACHAQYIHDQGRCSCGAPLRTWQP